MIEIIRRVICDHCGKPASDALESEDPEEVAKAEGWLIRADGYDYCPRCSPAESEGGQP